MNQLVTIYNHVENKVEKAVLTFLLMCKLPLRRKPTPNSLTRLAFPPTLSQTH